MGWVRAGRLDDLAKGGALGVTLGDRAIALYRLAGRVYATDNICTHQFAFLSDGYVDGGCIECPLHQARFDIATGAVLEGPAPQGLSTYPVRLEGEEIFVDPDAPRAAPSAVPAVGEAPSPQCPAPQRPVTQCIVIVGAGQAGARAAQVLRAEGYRGALVLIGAEQELPYERPPLSKGLLDGQQSLEDCRVLTATAFQELDLDWRPGRRVLAIDRSGRTLALDDGTRLPYDRLLLATGAIARSLVVAGREVPALTLRSAADATRIAAELRPDRRLVIVGGGFIGLELASAARKRGTAVTVIEREPALMARLLPSALSAAFKALAEAAGVTLVTGRSLSTAERDIAGWQLQLDDGTRLAADALVAGIGAAAETELARATGLAIEGGIVVDATGATSDPLIFAAGDCTLHHQAVGGRRIRLESWANAESQARAAARALLGLEPESPPLPWFWTEQFGCKIQIAGVPTPDDEVGRVGAEGSGAVYYGWRDGRLAWAAAFDQPDAFREARRLLTEGLPSDWRPPDLIRLGQGTTDAEIDGEASMASKSETPAQTWTWPAEGLTRIPDWVYRDEQVYAREVERIFQGPTWNYVALEAEIPNPGDFTRSYVGPTPVVVARGEDGRIHAFENRCSHRAAEFCRSLRGNTKEFVCPYHQWSYDLTGRLSGVPFRRGVDGRGGMPADFVPSHHGPRQLKVTTRRGVVFASYSDIVEPLETYLGPEILREFDATFDGRRLKILGYYRNVVPGNWKLYHENLRDPYHATLLHTFLVTFGLLVAGNRSLMLSDDSGRHGVMCSAKSDGKAVSAETRKEMRAYRAGMQLADPRFMDFVPEFNSPWSVTMATIWPNLIIQREMNTLGVRHIVPEGPDQFVMIWTMFGYEGDDETMTRHRLRQGNLMGPAGFLGLEDNEAIKFVQDGMKHVPDGSHLVALDPATEAGTADTLISEAAVRAMYRHWRSAVGL